MRAYPNFPIKSKAHVPFPAFPSGAKQGSTQSPVIINWQNTGWAACRKEVENREGRWDRDRLIILACTLHIKSCLMFYMYMGTCIKYLMPLKYFRSYYEL